MGQSKLTKTFSSETELTDFAAAFAQALAASGHRPLIVGLRGELGSGKTTWVRAMLRGLGYRQRVPSPTYTLLEQYACAGLNILHLDLYRLDGDAELEHLGLRDWLADPASWILLEWPERAPRLAAHCDLWIKLVDPGEGARHVVIEASTQPGILALAEVCPAAVNNKL
jgi:tRNA threonylcarbamoyladenosine biosynthesis protein TsaE